MGIGAVLEPLTVVVLLFGGTWINRQKDSKPRSHGTLSRSSSSSNNDEEAGFQPVAKQDTYGYPESRPLSPSLLHQHEPQWRRRSVGLGPYRFDVYSPNTAQFRNRFLSRLLYRLPFLVECWYWALVYWIYQLGRAFTAVTLKDDTVDVARKHAMQLVQLEKSLGIFVEVDIQRFFLARPTLMNWTNWIYSFIHIPGTIAFLVWLYYYTTTRTSLEGSSEKNGGSKPAKAINGSPAGPLLYAARRRTLAVCNLLAFIVFTLWPCMPPRLLSDEKVGGNIGNVARSYGFVDTVHGEKGAGSVWTENRFCNQYAAMPSLHFGYSLMIGLTIMTIPLSAQHAQSTTTSRTRSIRLPLSSHRISLQFALPSWRRVLCVALGVAYPLTILAAIVATANHFILDAVAGACVCMLGWNGNVILLNLLPVEDYFLGALRLYKPERMVVDVNVESHGYEKRVHASVLS
ncbi:hypothetical protein UA08_07773 [Talaromyces atroroseus]|uniref:Inositolphosphotransferase Aur1/Ipt1 domain-containing protein n=1 Tax=Talaromyces atroroseus TaxID=1441469 RepID=A0A225APA5_TALAT|nr:hypothetical protein UA08_07773 [Talaromyces atroroseus]OKL56796.1 hypothetical protein UA08_07773 [Talaromyces atroroseus]